MHYAGNLVEEIGKICLQYFAVIDKLINFADHEYRIDLGSWYHDLKTAVSRSHGLTDYYSA